MLRQELISSFAYNFTKGLSQHSIGPPSSGLVERVRELYKHNPSDVRFLIPVLHGLRKVRKLILGYVLLNTNYPLFRMKFWLHFLTSSNLAPI